MDPASCLRTTELNLSVYTTNSLTDTHYCLSGIPSVCKQVVSVETTRDIEWATFTCTLGFHVFGKVNVLCHGSQCKIIIII